MDHLPIFLNVKGTRSLVVGGGFLAARKADLLLRAGCKLTVLAPVLGEELTHLAQMQKFTWPRLPEYWSISPTILEAVTSSCRPLLTAHHC